MKYINWQSDAPAASVIGLGCMRISNMTESAVSALIDAALESGINLFDHADIYGGGESESVFGRVLASRPGLRDRMVIQSKCGIRKGKNYYEGYFYPKCKAVPTADGVQTSNSSVTLSGDSLSFSVFPRLNDQVVREISKRFDTEAEAITWCDKQLGISAS